MQAVSMQGVLNSVSTPRNASKEHAQRQLVGELTASKPAQRQRNAYQQRARSSNETTDVCKRVAIHRLAPIGWQYRPALCIWGYDARR